MSLTSFADAWNNGLVTTPAQRLVLMAIGDLADAAEIARPDIETIAFMARLSERETESTIEQLITLKALGRHSDGGLTVMRD
jgi:hypothetical protein